KIPIRILLDSGSAIPIVDSDFVGKWRLPTRSRSRYQPFRAADGTPLQDAGKIATLKLGIGYGIHEDLLAFEISKLHGSFDAILPNWWIRLHAPIRTSSGTLRFNSDYCRKKCWGTREQQVNEPDQPHEDKTVTTETLSSIQGLINPDDSREAYLQAAAVAVEEQDATPPQEAAQIRELVPAEYHRFIEVFGERFANQLPPHTKYDCEINLVPGAEPQKGRLYKQSANEREALREYIDEMERLGKIRRSSAPCSSPIMFVKKADGSLRPVVDYRALNKITVKDRTPLPLMDEIRDRVLGSKIFTRLDLKSGFNLIRIKEGHEWLTAFSTYLGLYEYLVMLFGLTNA